MKNLWSLTAIVIGGFGAVVALVLYAPEGRGDAAVVAILSMIGSVLTAAYVQRHVADVKEDVRSVKDQVNGRMTELIQKIPEPDRPAE